VRTWTIHPRYAFPLLLLLWTLLFLLSSLVAGRSQFVAQQPFLKAAGASGPCAPYSAFTAIDTMEDYSTFASVNGLNQGCFWPSGFVARENATPPNLIAIDRMENYTNGQAVATCNDGEGFDMVLYVARSWYLGMKASDDMESYSDGAGVNGLNGGSDWTDGYVDR
jgi:hypothetical protein